MNNDLRSYETPSVVLRKRSLIVFSVKQRRIVNQKWLKFGFPGLPFSKLVILHEWNCGRREEQLHWSASCRKHLKLDWNRARDEWQFWKLTKRGIGVWDSRKHSQEKIQNKEGLRLEKNKNIPHFLGTYVLRQFLTCPKHHTSRPLNYHSDPSLHHSNQIKQVFYPIKFGVVVQQWEWQKSQLVFNLKPTDNV